MPLYGHIHTCRAIFSSGTQHLIATLSLSVSLTHTNTYTHMRTHTNTHTHTHICFTAGISRVVASHSDSGPQVGRLTSAEADLLHLNAMCPNIETTCWALISKAGHPLVPESQADSGRRLQPHQLCNPMQQPCNKPFNCEDYHSKYLLCQKGFHSSLWWSLRQWLAVLFFKNRHSFYMWAE